MLHNTVIAEDKKTFGIDLWKQLSFPSVKVFTPTFVKTEMKKSFFRDNACLQKPYHALHSKKVEKHV